LDSIPDPREAHKTLYSARSLLWSGISMFLMGATSRRQFDLSTDSPTFVANFNQMASTDLEAIPDNKTVADYLKQVDPKELMSLPARMVRSMLEARALESERLFGRYLIAVDATGYWSGNTAPDDQCLHQTHDGKTRYYRLVLEAKLVTATGLAFSIASEFVENTDPQLTRQDCELKAAPRLLAKIKELFPRLPICLLMDSLYSNQHIFALCRANSWEFIVTFKDGRLPNLFREFQSLLVLQNEDSLEQHHNERYQRIRWMNSMEHEGNLVSALDCLTVDEHGEVQYFAWLTSLPIDRSTASDIANQGGRLRWKIENEGFNVQKNSDFSLKHPYSHDAQALKNYYLLLQVAHTILQLLIKGRLRDAFTTAYQTTKNLFRRLTESLRYVLIRAEEITVHAVREIQLRLGSG